LTLVTLGGELDLAAAAALRRGLSSIPSAALPDVAVDLSGVEFMDCATVGILIATHKDVRATGGCLRLFGWQREPARLMRLCHLDRVLCLHDCASAATAPVCSRHGAGLAEVPEAG